LLVASERNSNLPYILFYSLRCLEPCVFSAFQWIQSYMEFWAEVFVRHTRGCSIRCFAGEEKNWNRVQWPSENNQASRPQAHIKRESRTSETRFNKRLGQPGTSCARSVNVDQTTNGKICQC